MTSPSHLLQHALSQSQTSLRIWYEILLYTVMSALLTHVNYNLVPVGWESIQRICHWCSCLHGQWCSRSTAVYPFHRIASISPTHWPEQCQCLGDSWSPENCYQVRASPPLFPNLIFFTGHQDSFPRDSTYQRSTLSPLTSSSSTKESPLKIVITV